MKRLHAVIYGLIGTGLILLGSIGFLLPLGVLPDVAETLDSEALHILQEASSGAIALGLLSAWCAFHYSRAAHWTLTVFFLLIATLHWLDCIRDQGPLTSAVLNSAPAATLLVMGVVRRSDP